MQVISPTKLDVGSFPKTLTRGVRPKIGPVVILHFFGSLFDRKDEAEASYSLILRLIRVRDGQIFQESKKPQESRKP
jgi:hypothetical protein